MSEQIQISLHADQDELWKIFHTEVNEMIISKAGRRLFPTLKYVVSGLESNKLYAMMIEFHPARKCRFKFIDGKWDGSWRGDEHDEPQKCWHPDGVKSGLDWMANSVSFDRIKICSHRDSASTSMVYLHSMHKYVPVVTILESPTDFPMGFSQNSDQVAATVRIPHTEFIAVSAYQNQNVTELKVKHNSFAKRIRDWKQQASRKRSSPSIADSEDSDSQSPFTKWKRDSVLPLNTNYSSSPSSAINPFFLNYAFFKQMANNSLLPPMFPFLYGLPNFSTFSYFTSSDKQSNVAKDVREEAETEIDIVG